MKLIPLRDDQQFKSRDILKGVVSHAQPNQGINADEMRRRCRLLDALDAANGDTLVLEDADHALLKNLISHFPFSVAHPDLLAIIDDVIEAKAPEPAV